MLEYQFANVHVTPERIGIEQRTAVEILNVVETQTIDADAAEGIGSEGEARLVDIDRQARTRWYLHSLGECLGVDQSDVDQLDRQRLVRRESDVVERVRQ